VPIQGAIGCRLCRGHRVGQGIRQSSVVGLFPPEPYSRGCFSVEKGTCVGCDPGRRGCRRDRGYARSGVSAKLHLRSNTAGDSECRANSGTVATTNSNKKWRR
jgi:hypothetical protein